MARIARSIPLPAIVLLVAAAILAGLRWHLHEPSLPPLVPAVAGPGDHELASFARCHGPVRVTCVVDGDTIWYRGEKIRIADINAPEISEPQCDSERQLGQRATERLLVLLNAGRFSLEPGDRDHDKYGRRLLIATRGGQSLGAILVAEGLAEKWTGHRRDWC